MASKLFLILVVAVFSVAMAKSPVKPAAGMQPKENMKTAETLHFGFGAYPAIGYRAGFSGYDYPYYDYASYYDYPSYYPFAY